MSLLSGVSEKSSEIVGKGKAESGKGLPCCAIGVWYSAGQQDYQCETDKDNNRATGEENILLLFGDGERRIYTQGKLKHSGRVKGQVISNVTAMQEWGVMFCICNGELWAMKLEPDHIIQGTKNVLAKSVVTYAVSRNNGVAILCRSGNVVVLQHTSWNEQARYTTNLDAAKSLIWIKGLLCIHGAVGSQLIDVRTGTSKKNVFPGGDRLLGFDFNDEEVLLVKGNKGYLLSSRDGEPRREEENCISWMDAPLSVHICGPFVFGRFRRSIQVHLWINGEAIDLIDRKNEVMCCWKNTFVYIVYSDSSLHKYDIRWKLPDETVDFHQSILLLEAWETCGRKEDKELHNDLIAKYGRQLFQKGDFKGALQQFLRLPYDQENDIVVNLFYNTELLSDFEKNPSEPSVGSTSGGVICISTNLDLGRAIREFLLPYVFAQNLVNKSPQLDTLLLKAFVLEKIYVNREATIDKARYSDLVRRKREFLRGQNLCIVEECEKLLLTYPEMWEDLLWLYYGKRAHQRALEWLCKLCENDRDIIADGELLSPTRSPHMAKMLEYLRKLGKPFSKVVFEYATIVIQSCSPHDAISVFIDLPVDTEPIDPMEVLEYLEKQDEAVIKACVKSSSALPQENDTTLAILFIQNLIASEEIGSPILHNKLAILLLQFYMHLCAMEAPQRDKVRKQLFQFLRYSKYYTAQELAPHFKSTELHEEYAVILARMGRHRDALRIYTHTLKSHKRAREYCEMVYNQNPDIFVMLLETYLQESPPNISQAVHLLQKHHSKVPPETALEMLPDQTKFSHLQNYVANVLTHQQARNRQNKILLQLIRKEHLKTTVEKKRLERKHVIITRDTVCANPNCQRRFQSDSAFARLPNGDIMHYACYEKK